MVLVVERIQNQESNGQISTKSFENSFTILPVCLYNRNWDSNIFKRHNVYSIPPSSHVAHQILFHNCHPRIWTGGLTGVSEAAVNSDNRDEIGLCFVHSFT